MCGTSYRSNTKRFCQGCPSHNWVSECVKLQSLLGVMLLSWTVWILRTNCLLMHQLGPGSSEYFWVQRRIHWIAYFIVMTVFGTLLWAIIIMTSSGIDTVDGDQQHDSWIDSLDVEGAWWMLRYAALSAATNSL